MKVKKEQQPLPGMVSPTFWVAATLLLLSCPFCLTAAAAAAYAAAADGGDAGVSLTGITCPFFLTFSLAD